MSNVVKMNVTKAVSKPTYKTNGSAGMDIQANNVNNVVIHPGSTKMIHTGVFIELPEGMECQVRSRSGLALTHGVVVLTSPGTIDSDYRGEIKIMLHNFGDKNFTVRMGDRIAQLVFSKVEQVDVVCVRELSETERGSSGFGSTGIV